MDGNPYEAPQIPADPVDSTYRFTDCSSCLAAGLMCVIVAIAFVTLVALVLR